MGNAAYICTMFINKSRNKSGTTSVRVLEKRGRNSVLVKSMGSSRDEKEIEQHFESADEDDLRPTGYTKDGKFDCPQVLLGLLVTREGLPISYEIFEGDLSEKKTFIPLLKRAQERFGFGKPIVIADSGLLSRKNIATLVEDGYEYILGARIKNETAGVKERITGLGLKDGEAKSVATDDGLRIVVSFTEKRRKKDGPFV